jgi:hypothetical protein
MSWSWEVFRRKAKLTMLRIFARWAGLSIDFLVGKKRSFACLYR